MLAHMKVHPTDQGGEVLLTVPLGQEHIVGDAIQKFLELSGHTVDVEDGEEDDDDRIYTVDEVFPDRSPAKRLRGIRTREDLTQAQMAQRLGTTQTTISDMERGARPISKKMAKRVEKEFGAPYQIFI